MSHSLWLYELQHARLPILHYFLEFAQTHVHGVGDAIQLSHPLSPPSPPALNLSQHQGIFQWVGSHIRWPKYWSFCVSPSNEHSGLVSFRIDGFDLCCPRKRSTGLLDKSLCFISYSFLSVSTLYRDRSYSPKPTSSASLAPGDDPLLSVCTGSHVLANGMCFGGLLDFCEDNVSYLLSSLVIWLDVPVENTDGRSLGPKWICRADSPSP